jgi:hypothetical protein
VIARVQEITGLEVDEVRELINTAPAPLIEGIAQDEVARIRRTLEDAGAVVVVATALHPESDALAAECRSGRVAQVQLRRRINRNV